MAALASLTADYNDSDEEPIEKDSVDQLKDVIEDEETKDKSSPKSAKSVSRLVSYGGDEHHQGDEEEEEVEEQGERSSNDDVDQSVPMDLDSDNDGNVDDVEDAEHEESQGPDVHSEEIESSKKEEKTTTIDPKRQENARVSLECWLEGEHALPPQPQGQCDPRLQSKIAHLMMEKERKGMDINRMIQNKKSFRNPSIYEKLIQFCGIDEHGTNLPKELYDGHLFGAESYYEELAKVQASDMERREKAMQLANKARQSIVQRHDDGGLKRRSKWDQTSASSKRTTTTSTTTAAQVRINVPPPTVVSAGAKSIPAFGPLRK